MSVIAQPTLADHMGLLSEQLEFLARSAAARAGISRSHAGTLRDVEQALREDGIHEALAVLNRRGHLRFTAVARFDPPIRLASGRVWGVLAHHDAVPHLIAPGHPELLLESAAIVGRWLAEHGHAPADGILPS